MSQVFIIRGDYIQLDQLLKATGLCGTGGEAHAAVESGQVLVDGHTETRKRAKLRPGQTVTYGHDTVGLTEPSGQKSA